MSDYISREAAIEALGDVHPLDYNAQTYKHNIENLPAADVREVKRGKWGDVSEYAVIPSGKCSVCGKYNRITNFCPNCGARMVNDDV